MTTEALLLERIEALHAKIDRIERRQRVVEDLVDEMTPVAREALTAMAGPFAELEAKGWFAVGNELLALADRVVVAYGPEEVRALGDQIVAILDTVRNMTQPDVLELANEATDVLHHADEVAPVGVFGAMKATSEAEVQRGMAVALEVLRHLGRARTGASAPVRKAPAPPPAPSAPAASAPTPAPRAVAPSAAPPPAEIVMWEGVRFNGEGFLVDREDWNEDLAAKMAGALGITLTDDHWAVLRWIREDHAASGASPNVRKVGTGSGFGVARLYELFPKTPGKTAARLAGVPKPVGCI